jgi:phage terminase large subunit-like protein
VDLSFLKSIDTDAIRVAQIIKKANPFTNYYPEGGRLSRYAYPKAMQFFNAGAKHKIRLVIAGNRVGKSEGMGGFETAMHLTGDYPDWWKGKRFDKPIKAVCASHTVVTTRDICQYKLFGEPDECGAGLIPFEAVGRIRNRMGVANAYDTVQVKHKSGGWSIVRFLAFEQGRKKFEGTERDWVWLDEEPPLDVATECLIRTMTTGGSMVITFTPLQGYSDTVQYCQDNSTEKGGDIYVCNITWDDVPHLTQEDKDMLWSLIPPYQRDARAKGMPALGSGAIYPIEESFVFIEPFEIPRHWRHCYGLDVGWNNTACLWIATDPDTGQSYAYSEHLRGEAEAVIHAHAIKTRGDMWGVIDPASRGRNQKDGTNLMTQYEQLGLKLEIADNSVEAGLWKVYQQMVSGNLKIFKSLTNTLREFRIYRRDEKGRIVKQDDHLMDALRYAIMTGVDRAEPLWAMPDYEAENYRQDANAGGY